MYRVPEGVCIGFLVALFVAIGFMGGALLADLLRMVR
jgi:hypothetical protein